MLAVGIMIVVLGVGIAVADRSSRVAAPTGASPDAAASQTALPKDTCDPSSSPGDGYACTMISPFTRLGVTHAQYSADGWHDETSVQAAVDLLSSARFVQNQYLMGWGASNPEPSPGVYDFDRLDERMSLIARTGGMPVITLAGAPDWMKGGKAGTTDWTRLDAAPVARHYDDFAALAATVARRYPQVRHFVVWSEMRGFWDEGRQRWDVESYTTLYNKVYAALKAVDPEIAVGGPYVNVASWQGTVAWGSTTVTGSWGAADTRSLTAISEWQAGATGADFVAVDGGTLARDRANPDSPVGAADTAKLSAVVAWLRSTTGLPVWWLEVYPGAPDVGPESSVHAAAMLDAQLALVEAGAEVTLLWQPEAAPSWRFPVLWRSPKQGGEVTPLGDAMAWLVGLQGRDVAVWRSATDVVVRSGAEELVYDRTGTEPALVRPIT